MAYSTVLVPAVQGVNARGLVASPLVRVSASTSATKNVAASAESARPASAESARPVENANAFPPARQSAKHVWRNVPAPGSAALVVVNQLSSVLVRARPGVESVPRAVASRFAAKSVRIVAPRPARNLYAIPCADGVRDCVVLVSVSAAVEPNAVIRNVLTTARVPTVTVVQSVLDVA